ncbi:GAF domain-containing protein [bacterium]|nr:GAF domain-containing protein [bacterium]
MGAGFYYGYRHRAEIWSEIRDTWTAARRWSPLFTKRPTAPSAGPKVEQTGHRWLFPEPKLVDARREGFEALSESFLLLKRIVPYHTASLFEYDADARQAYPRLYCTESENFRKDIFLSPSDGIVGYSLSTGKPVHYTDFKGDARLLGYYASPEEIRSVIVFPLDRSDRRLGALAVDSLHPDAFSAKQDEIRHLATMFSELLVRVQREETLLMRLEEDRMLKAMTERMARAGVSIEDVAESLCTLAKDVFPADRVTFVVFDDPPESSGFPVSAGGATTPSMVRFRSLKMLDRYVELVARTRKTVRLDDLWENSLMSLATGQAGVSTRSMLAAPFVFSDQCVGVVLLESDRSRAFNVFHETAVGELVQHAATAVARAIEYGRMEKTCVIADVVPSAADRIFSEPTLDGLVDLIKTRFGATAAILEVLDDKQGDVRTRPWESGEAAPEAPSSIQRRAIETVTALIRVDGSVTPVKDYPGELPVSADVVFPLTSGSHAQRPFGLFSLSIHQPLRPEGLHILERVRALVQIRLILERRERQFGFLKQRDSLTGVFHTAAFEKKLESRIRSATENSGAFHLILIEPKLSALKRTHGFAETSRRYMAMCSEIERLCGPESVVGRLGPDDVGVIWEGGRDVIETVKRQIARMSETLGFPIGVGSSEFPREGETPEALIEAAGHFDKAAILPCGSD